MVIEAISNVNLKNNNVSFGKRGSEKPVQNQHSSNPLKAVPLAVLVAMSPLNTTNAENIIRAERTLNTTELAQNIEPKVVNLGQFKIDNDIISVFALNSKGKTDSFDKIEIYCGGYNFDVKEVLDKTLYLYSGNGVKENFGNFKEIIATTEENGKVKRANFIDPNVVNYVEELLSQETNKTGIKSRAKESNIVLIRRDVELGKEPSDDDYLMGFVSDAELKEKYLPLLKEKYKKLEGNFFLDGKEVGEELRLMGHVEMEELRKRVAGSNGSYTMKFYTDKKGNKDKFNEIVVQKDGEPNSFTVRYVVNIQGEYLGMDNELNFVAPSLDLMEDFMLRDCELISDEILTDEVLKAINSPKCDREASRFDGFIKEPHIMLVSDDCNVN